MKRLTWLHLSDLHFGKPEDAWDAEAIQRQLINDLKKLEREKQLVPDLIFFTGDLAFGHLGSGPSQGLKDQYQGVHEFLETVRKTFKEEIPQNRIFLVPGNHDVNRKFVDDMTTSYLDGLSDENTISDLMAGGGRTWVYAMDRLKDYTRFLKDYGYGHLLQDENRLTYGLTVTVNGIRVGIGGFNGVWSCARKSADERGKLRVGWKWQKTLILDKIRDSDVKIALSHHPFSWGCEAENKYAKNFLPEEFQFILTGHEHWNNVNLSAKGHAVIGADACYHRTEGSGYNITCLDFENRTGRVFLREYREDHGGGWVGKNTTKTEKNGYYPLEHLDQWMQKKSDPDGEKTTPEVKLDTKTSSIKDEKSSLEFQDLLNAYKRKAASLYEKLPMIGFRTQLRVAIRIDDIYMPLQAIVDESIMGDACFADAEDARACLEKRGVTNEIPVPDAFARCREVNKKGVVILGDPGSGKTTHLKRLLLWALSDAHEKTGLPRNTVPVFLPLREYKDRDKSLTTFIQDRLCDTGLGMPPSFADRLLKTQPVLLLFDGLDEVRDIALRAALARQIEAFVNGRENLFSAVTCRFAGYDTKTRLNSQYLELHLRPLTRDQAQDFILTWYTLVEANAVEDPNQAKAIAREKSGKLIELLNTKEFRARRVFEMTRNPLLLTNLCLVHRDQGKLPKNRARLYRDSIDILLDLWKGAQGMESRFDAETAGKVLQSAALWMHGQENRVRAKGRELAQVMNPVLERVRWPHGSAKNFLKLVRDESGLLTGWGDGSYGFMHLGFQEYLAAREIRSLSFDDPTVLTELAKHFGQSWWDEVILLLLGLEEPSRFKAFMTEVVKLPVFPENPALVDLCLDDAAEIDTELFLNLLKQTPGKNRAKWDRQLAALRVVERLAPDALKPLASRLSNHPMEEIRNRFAKKTVLSGTALTGTIKSGTQKIQYDLVQIPGGSFMMGSPESEKDRHESENPLHEVTVPPFYMGRYPVTNEDYGRYLADNPKAESPKFWGDRKFNGPRQPVVGVSWDEATAFARWAGLGLPSEAQWEYACRAGSETRFYSGDQESDLERVGWFGNNSNNRLHPVGEKDPNKFGLYDMHGNVWEWMLDHWYDNYKGAPDDGSAWIDKGGEGRSRVLRGGCFANVAWRCRSADRYGGRPSYRLQDYGFRLVLLPGRQPGQ